MGRRGSPPRWRRDHVRGGDARSHFAPGLLVRGMVLVVALAGCGSSAVDMTLLLPADQADFDLTCVTAVDVVPLAAKDTMPLDFAARTDDFPCISIKTPVDKFTKLAAAMAGKIDVPLPANG